MSKFLEFKSSQTEEKILLNADHIATLVEKKNGKVEISMVGDLMKCLVVEGDYKEICKQVKA